LLTADSINFQYKHGVPEEYINRLSPDGLALDIHYMDTRNEMKDVQLDLWYSYGTNVESYPKWQAYLENHKYHY